MMYITQDQESAFITIGTMDNSLFVMDTYEKYHIAYVIYAFTQVMHDIELWQARFGQAILTAC